MDVLGISKIKQVLIDYDLYTRRVKEAENKFEGFRIRNTCDCAKRETEYNEEIAKLKGEVGNDIATDKAKIRNKKYRLKNDLKQLRAFRKIDKKLMQNYNLFFEDMKEEPVLLSINIYGKYSEIFLNYIVKKYSDAGWDCSSNLENIFRSTITIGLKDLD